MVALSTLCTGSLWYCYYTCASVAAILWYTDVIDDNNFYNYIQIFTLNA